MLAPFAGYLMQIAMSRNREYLADASGVQLTRYPPGLISRAREAAGRPRRRPPRDARPPRRCGSSSRSRPTTKKPGSKFNKLVRHPPAARGPHQAAAGDVVEARPIAWSSVGHAAVAGTLALDRLPHAAGAATRRRRRRRRRPPPSASTTTTVPIPIAPLTGLPDPGRRQPHPARAVGEGGEHARRPDPRPASTRPTWSTRRRSRATSPASSPSSTRRARHDRPGALGPRRGPRHRVAARRHLRLLGRRAGQRRRDQRRAGARRRRDAGRRRPWCATRRASRRARRPTTSTATARRCSRSAATPKPPPALFEYVATGCAADHAARACSASHVGFDAGYDPTWTWDAASRHLEALASAGPRRPSGPGARSRPPTWWCSSRPYTGDAEAQTVGEGDVWVFTDGAVRTGRWVRPDKTKPATLRRRRRPADPAAARAAPGWSCCRWAARSTSPTPRRPSTTVPR